MRIYIHHLMSTRIRTHFPILFKQVHVLVDSRTIHSCKMAPTTYKWSYNLYKWRTIHGLHWVFLTPRIGVVSPHLYLNGFPGPTLWYHSGIYTSHDYEVHASLVSCARCMDTSPTWNVKHGHTRGNWLGKYVRPIGSIRNRPGPILDQPPWPFVYFAGDLLQMLLFVLTGSQLIIVRHLWRFTQWSNGPPKNDHVIFFFLFFWGGGTSTLEIDEYQIHMVGSMFTWSLQSANIWIWD